MDSQNLTIAKRTSSASAADCPECDFRDLSAEKTCPRCGADLINVRQVRALASIPLVVGASTLMGGIIGYVTVLKVHAGRQVFRADDEFTLKLSTGIFIVFGVVGLLIIAASLCQMATGKFYGRLLKILIVATIVLGMIMEIYFAYLHSR